MKSEKCRDKCVKWENKLEELRIAISMKMRWIMKNFHCMKKKQAGKPRWSPDLTSEIPFHHIKCLLEYINWVELFELLWIARNCFELLRIASNYSKLLPIVKILVRSEI